MFIKNKKAVLIMLIIAILGISACGSIAESEIGPLEFTDDLGRTITLDEYPNRIVSVAASTTESLFVIGAGESVVGRDDFSFFPEEVLEIPSIGSFWDGVPAETILALEPDLVIAAEIISAEQVQEMEDLGLTVYWQANPVTFDDLYENLLELGVLTGFEEEAEEAVQGLEERVNSTLDVLQGVENTPVVFFELDATDPSNPWTVGSGTFIDYLIVLAGGENAASAVVGDYAMFSSEALIAANPDIILLADALYGVTVESVAERAGWGELTAVVNGSVYPADPAILSVPGPRLVDGFEFIAQSLHPELFGE